MFFFNPIPERTVDVLNRKRIDTESILFGMRCDRTAAFSTEDTYLFATEKEVICLSEREEVVSYPIADIERLSVEEFFSSARLVAFFKNRDAVILGNFTNFCKEAAFVFTKYAGKLSRGEAFLLEESDRESAQCCPICGRRYPDQNRKVCPNCMKPTKIFKRFLPFLLRYKWMIFWTVLSLLIMTATGIATPYLSSGFFYDEVIYGDGAFAGRLLLVLGLVVGAKLIRVFATMVNNYVTSVVAAKMVYDLKTTIFTAIERLSLSFFTGRQTGGLMTQVNEDANTIYTFFCDGVPALIVNAAEVIILVFLLFWIHPLLAVIALATLPAFLLVLRWIFRKQKSFHARRYSASKQMNGFLADVFTGARIVKAFSGEDAERERFHIKNDRLAGEEKSLSLFSNYARPIAGAVLYFAKILVWGLGGFLVFSGSSKLTYGMLLTFTTYMAMVFTPMEFFTNFFEMFADCTNSMQRLFEIMDAKSDVVEDAHPLRPENLGTSVEFDHVSFSYQKGRKVIDDVSFSVEAGKILGIVGHSGAGKSTLVNLLLRLYDSDEGEIRIGGIPVKKLALSTIYENVAIVSQETYLFIGSILDNIRYAKPDATFDEVLRASKFAGAHEFIVKLPDAYHTKIGFGYQNLSGGEKQRISIARAILKNPRILILDEATASMDTQTERKIQAALTELVKGKTTIMIAHRLSTLRDADSLVVIEHGRVAERGTHRELLEKEDGVYKLLYTLQEDALKRAGICDFGGKR